MPQATSHKLLCIVGPTASSKTGIAVKLSRLFPSILISADSRQVYRGMDIVTGKDHPANIQIIGVDILDPDEDCSVAVWHKTVMPHIKQAWDNYQLPIVVGGTGLYIKSLVNNIETMNIPRNHKLRKKLESLSISDLQSRLSDLDNTKLTSLNESDIQNPRRLIRAIEVVGMRSSHPSIHQFTLPDSLIIGLRYSDRDTYQKSIRSRVEDRLTHGALEETSQLINKYSSNLSSFSSLGYSYIIQFLNNKITHDKLINSWTQSELSYVKRQMTWFNKISNIHWYNPTDQSTFSLVATLVKDWYSS